MQLIKIKPSKIKIPANRITSEMSEETQDQLRSFLAGSGLIAPVVVQQIEGELFLVDGKHRVDELIAAGDKEIDAALIEGDMVDLLTRNLFLDHVRGDHKVGDMIRLLKVLNIEHNLDVVAIEEKTGLTRSYIEKILKIGDAGPAVQFALEEGVITVSHAFEIARLPREVQREEMVQTQIVFRTPVKELKTHIDEVLRMMQDEPPPPPVQEPAEPPPPRVFACGACKNEGEFKDFKPVMVCPSCFSRVWQLGRAAEDKSQPAAEETGGG